MNEGTHYCVLCGRMGPGREHECDGSQERYGKEERLMCAHGRPDPAMCPWCNGINSPVPAPDTEEKR